MEETIIKSYYIETARKNLEIAHQQLSVRARLRDNALLVYLTITATIFGIVFKTDENLEILLIIPYLALGISIIVSHHNLIIGTLFDFLKEIRFFLISYNLPGQEVPQYDCSESYENYRVFSLVLRTFGHSIIILMPCIVALILNWKDDFNSLDSVTPAWWFSALCTGVAILGFVSIHFLRYIKSRKLLSKMEILDSRRLLSEIGIFDKTREKEVFQVMLSACLIFASMNLNSSFAQISDSFKMMSLKILTR